MSCRTEVCSVSYQPSDKISWIPEIEAAQNIADLKNRKSKDTTDFSEDAHMIYEYFRITGTNEDIPEFSSYQALLSEETMFEALILNGTKFSYLGEKLPRMTYWKACSKQKLRDSEQLQTVFPRYNQDTYSTEE